MPLAFRGLSIANPARTAVRFAGYEPKREAFVIICEITAEALKALCDPTVSFDLEEAFSAHQSKIHDIASGKFDAGSMRPRITTQDIEALVL